MRPILENHTKIEYNQIIKKNKQRLNQTNLYLLTKKEIYIFNASIFSLLSIKKMLELIFDCFTNFIRKLLKW